ncbi:hypothetical protein FS837_007546 [Tulasnella sp. UAMH 9824]|nr:hypothetical protein FS837_007546 [Tulasnella sp. UAMH 9824]
MTDNEQFKDSRPTHPYSNYVDPYRPMNRTDSVPSLSEDTAPGLANAGAARPSEPKRTVSWAIDTVPPERTYSPVGLVADPRLVFIPGPPPPSREQSELQTPIRVSSFSEETTPGTGGASFAAIPSEPRRPSARGGPRGWGMPSPQVDSVEYPTGIPVHAPSGIGQSTRSMNIPGVVRTRTQSSGDMDYYGSRPQNDIPRGHYVPSGPTGPTAYPSIPSSTRYPYPADPYDAYHRPPPTIPVNQHFLPPFDKRFLLQEDFGSHVNSGWYRSASAPMHSRVSHPSIGPPQGGPGWLWNGAPTETLPNTTRPIDDIFDFKARLRAEPQYIGSRDVPARSSAPGYPPPSSRVEIVNVPGYVARQLLYLSDPRDAESTLSNLLKLTATGEFDRGWVVSLVAYAPLLKAFLRLADSVTPVENTLDPKSPCAKVIDMALEHYPAQLLLSQMCTPDAEGSVAMRYVIQKARSSKNPIRSGEIGYHNIAEHALYVMRLAGAESVAAINAIRLVECILPGVHTVGELQENSFREFLRAVSMILAKRDMRASEQGEKVDPARRVAALHLVSSTIRTYKSLLERSKATCQTPWTPDEEWILQDIGVDDVLPYLKDDDADPLVRCLALRVIRDFGEVGPEDVHEWKDLDDIIKTSVSVLLQKTHWQYGHGGKAGYLDLVGFSPLDDAYQILGLSPPEIVISALSEGLDVAAKSPLLEPLISLIVDHSELKDRHWPFMLRNLVHGGCLSLLHDLLLHPLEEEEGTWQRIASRMRSQACIALTRCFEQMQAKDMNLVPSDIGKIFVNTATDESLPLYLRDSASDALKALNE